MGAADSRSLRPENYARMKDFVRRYVCVPFRRLLGDVHRELMHRLSVVLHGTLGSYPRGALHEGGATADAGLLARRASMHVFFSSLLVDSTTFFRIKLYN
jgi:hypothetical protein